MPVLRMRARCRNPNRTRSTKMAERKALTRSMRAKTGRQHQQLVPERNQPSTRMGKTGPLILVRATISRRSNRCTAVKPTPTRAGFFCFFLSPSTFVGVYRSQVVCTVTFRSDVLVTTEQEVLLPACRGATLSDGAVHESAHRLLLCCCSCLGSLSCRRSPFACNATSRSCPNL